MKMFLTRHVLIVFLIFLFEFRCRVQSARILCVFTMPSISHQMVFRAYTQELAKQGNELVIITTDPALTKERPPDNVTEIDIGFAYEFWFNLIKDAKGDEVLKRGVIFDMKIFDLNKIRNLLTMYVEQLNHPEVMQVVKNNNQKFDLIVMEAFTDYTLVISHFIKAPLILFSSFYGNTDNYDTVGAISRHPVLYPTNFRIDFDNLTMWDKLKVLYYEYFFFLYGSKTKQVGNELLKEQYGPETPTIEELRNNVDMLFLNSHPIFDGNRPVPPNVVHLGNLHLKPPKELPQDLKTFLDASKRGVIYVSLGTNVHPSRMDPEFLDVFLDAFSKLPYDIFWKFDEDNLEKMPKNLQIRKWFPQRDLLLHSNIKLFITQGGIQSVGETIDAAVPIVSIPFLADQWYNSYRYSDLGIGIKLDPRVLTADVLVDAVKTVINYEKYKRNTEKIRSIVNDQPETPLQRAIWWTEYVLRHGGARHLRSPAANLTWSEYLMLDILIPILCSLTIVIIFISLTLFCIAKSLLKAFKTKEKQN